MTNPPIILVKTWYELLTQSDDDASKEHAERMLMGAFGSHQAIYDYLKQHKIID
ncbi:hypothetical protein PN836_020325 [Ningiella sp. W23]|uniref:hypothetical protein n=1 Tax=Ningiella sp. W23 TaxID=3023715 RepID=UPI003757D22B